MHLSNHGFLNVLAFILYLHTLKVLVLNGECLKGLDSTF